MREQLTEQPPDVAAAHPAIACCRRVSQQYAFRHEESDRNSISDVVDALQARLQAPSLDDELMRHIHRRPGLLVPSWTAPSQAPERRHEAGARQSDRRTTPEREKTNGRWSNRFDERPRHQTTNVGRSGDSSAADASAKAKFGEALKQESCPKDCAGGPPKDAPTCRPPSIRFQPFEAHNPPRSTAILTASKAHEPRSDGPDFSKPTPSCPIPPFRSLKVPTTPVTRQWRWARTSAGGNGRSESDGIARRRHRDESHGGLACGRQVTRPGCQAISSASQRQVGCTVAVTSSRRISMIMLDLEVLEPVASLAS